MVDAKRASQVVKILPFFYLILFPLAQLLRSDLRLLGKNLVIHPSDIVVFFSFLFLSSSFFKIPKLFRSLSNFLVIAGFSLLFSISFIPINELLVGFLYLARIGAYFSFFVLVFNSIKKKSEKKNLFKLLISVSFLSSFLGWIQYFLYPNLTFLKYSGWGDHLYRLTGTFLDPAFSGIILVFGFWLSFYSYLFKRGKFFAFLSLFFLISIAFTYSRASYLALIASIFHLFVFKKRIKILALVPLIFIVIVLFLPRPSSEGVRLERSRSVYSKVQNYKETLQIIRQYPLFGVGFNNLCFVRMKTFGGEGASHACSGSDSSLLFVLATTGILGLISFINILPVIVKNISRGIYGQSFLSCLIALLIHSLFVNSLFYPWVMGFMGILLAISSQEKSGSKRYP